MKRSIVLANGVGMAFSEERLEEYFDAICDSPEEAQAMRNMHKVNAEMKNSSTDNLNPGDTTG